MDFGALYQLNLKKKKLLLFLFIKVIYNNFKFLEGKRENRLYNIPINTLVNLLASLLLIT